MSFDDIFDLTAGVYFCFYNIYIADVVSNIFCYWSLSAAGRLGGLAVTLEYY